MVHGRDFHRPGAAASGSANIRLPVAMRRHGVTMPRDSPNESVKDFDRRFEDVADAALGDNELRL